MDRFDSHARTVGPAAALALALAGAFIVVAVAEDMPYAQPDEAWVSINGKVEAVTPDSFTLDYGGGLIVVEMDDGDRDADAYKLMEGDQVNVIGKIDDDLFETTTIEASTVYVEKLGTTFFASAVDEEDVVLSAEVPLDLTVTTVRGTVESLGDEQFTLDTGPTDLTVVTGGLGYDPLDDTGYQQVDIGDRVSVSGDIDEQFFGGPKILADSLIVLQEARP